MKEDMGALTGSREPSHSTVSRPIGFDPERELELEANYADHMADMAHYWMKRAQDAERLVPLLVHSAGGEIAVSQLCLAMRDSFKLERWQSDYDMTVRFRARPTPSPTRHQEGTEND